MSYPAILWLTTWILLFAWAKVLQVDALMARTTTPPVLSQWLTIAQHLQNPELYAAEWADGAIWNKKDQLISKSHVTRGQILSLVPMERLALRGKDPVDSTMAYTFSTELTRPDVYHRASGLTQDVQVVVYPSKRGKQRDNVPGWRGHSASEASEGTMANCRVVPLLGALPLCALVATQDILENTPLFTVHSNVDDVEPDSLQDLEGLSLAVLKRYTAEITELRSYMAMAHPFPPPLDLPEWQPWKFHAVDTTYPGLQSIHTDPTVYQVDDFLTSNECQAIIDWAKPRLTPCLIKNAETGAVEPDPTRTSTNANLPQSVVPNVTEKVMRLLNSPSERHLEIFQVLRYTPGQVFLPHTDGFDGPIDACGFEQSGRLVTLFCYLNTVPKGGETHFPQLDLSCTPVQGKAVLHFPNSVHLQQDLRTEHESVPVVEGEKWLFVTWCWKHARANPAYHEALLEDE